ncbi:hypothetical protein Tco_0550802 [Tanacetum coccineum]
MSTFIKNQSSWKLSQLKKLSFEELKTEFEKLMKSIESFVPMETKARVKRHGLQLEQETSKKQKIDIEDASITKGKDEVVKEEEADSIVPVKKTIIRKDGSDKIYMGFQAILKDFSRDELVELYRLVIKKYGANRPEEMYDRVLWGDLKTMFNPPLNRKYPLSKDACQVMLKMKLLDGIMDEVCYQFLKMIEKQAGIRK